MKWNIDPGLLGEIFEGVAMNLGIAFGVGIIFFFKNAKMEENLPVTPQVLWEIWQFQDLVIF